MERSPLSVPHCRLLALLLVGIIGCGDDTSTPDGSAPDGGTDSGADGGGTDRLPNIPWLADGVPPIMVAPCPEGWRERVVDGVAVCDPYPESGAATCENGQAHFPGEPGCRPIGEDCPAGDYAASLPTPPPTDGSVVYVKAGAAAGGDGSHAMPYAALSELRWTWLSPGATVALAKGTYPGNLQVKEGVRVVGACVRETRVTGDASSAPAVVVPINGVGEAMIQNLTIAGTAQVGLAVVDGHSLTAQGVLIEGSRAVGVNVANRDSVVTLRDAVIRDTRPQTTNGIFGRGINVQNGAELTAARLLVEESHDLGVHASGDAATVNLTDTVVRDTQPLASDGTGGRGVNAQAGATIVAERLLVERNHESGVYVGGDSSMMTLTDTVVRDTQPQGSSGAGGRGVYAEEGGQLTASRLLVEGNLDFGVFVSQPGTSASLEDTVVRGTQPQMSDGEFGRGIGVQKGAQLTAARLLVQSNHEIGFYVGDAATAVTLTDALIRDARPQPGDDTMGRGIHIQNGSRMEGDRVVIEDSREFGILAIDDVTVDLRDVVVAHVERAACASTTCPRAAHGHAVATLSSAIRLTRFQIRDAATCGLFIAASGTSATPTALDLEAGAVSESEIGACLQVDGYDLDRLTNDVRYLDNATNFDSTTLPLPTPLSSVDL